MCHEIDLTAKAMRCSADVALAQRLTRFVLCGVVLCGCFGCVALICLGVYCAVWVCFGGVWVYVVPFG